MNSKVSLIEKYGQNGIQPIFELSLTEVGAIPSFRYLSVYLFISLSASVVSG